MPFTFSHPAIVLPLKRFSSRYVSMTGLIIGSMLPDFEYFIRMRLLGVFGHTLPAVFYFALPLGILLTFVFHNIVRNELIDNLPKNLNARFSDYKQLNWNLHFRKNILVVISSLLIGVFSHFFWDSFTHETGFFVQIIPFLANEINLSGLQISVYGIIQHLSTLIGAFFILLFVKRLPKKENSEYKANWKYWAIWIIFTLIIIAARLLYELSLSTGHLVVITISACLSSIVLTSIAWRFIAKDNYGNVEIK